MAEDEKKQQTITIFGASGDLARKKTFPALERILNAKTQNTKTHIFGYARSDISPKTQFGTFASSVTYVRGEYTEPADFQHLLSEITAAEQKKPANRIFYLALPPSVYSDISVLIRKYLYTETGWNRIVVEKPFGKDEKSSEKLATELIKQWKEEEIYRIDHYLGKEMVKNIMVLRFANMIFNSQWNRKYINNVQITFKEPFGTEGRGGYFDEFGIIRDVMQNHLFQILTCIAMETPLSLSAEDVRDEKVKVARSVKQLAVEDVMIGQYVGDKGKPGYKDDKGVPKDSITPTFALAVMEIDNERWSGVPFILKCGKALNEQKAEIRIQFRDVPGAIYPKISRNELVIRVQPDEAVYMKVMNKQPGHSSEPIISELDLTYKSRFSEHYIPDAYESLILDVMRGDHSNFVRADELLHAWKVVTPLLHQLESDKIQPLPYKYGSRGPEGADDFIRKRGGFRRHEQPYSWSKPNSPKL